MIDLQFIRPEDAEKISEIAYRLFFEVYPYEPEEVVREFLDENQSPESIRTQMNACSRTSAGEASAPRRLSSWKASPAGIVSPSYGWRSTARTPVRSACMSGKAMRAGAEPGSRGSVS